MDARWLRATLADAGHCRRRDRAIPLKRDWSSKFPNLTPNKIPNAVMGCYDWGRDDYRFAIASLPPAPEIINREIREIREKGNAKQVGAGQKELEL